MENKELNKLAEDFMALKEQQKTLDALIETTKSQLMAFNGISTDKYTFAVVETPSERVVGKAELIRAIGEDKVKDLGLLKTVVSKMFKIITR